MIANRIAYGETLVELAGEMPELMVLDADACKSTGTLSFSKKIPERFVQCGIAEQNMVGVAAGLASCGKVAFATTFSVFTSMRAVEQLRNTVCYSNLNVKIGGTHAGLETGGDGGTHQAIEDIAIIRSLPRMKLVVPASPNATRKLTRLAAKTYGPFYIRMGKDPNEEIYDENEMFPLGGSKKVCKGNDATIIACGNMVVRAMKAAKILEKQGKQVRVIDMYSIKPIDKESIIRAAKETGGIVTVEDHSVIGGLGGAVCEVVAENVSVKVIRMGMDDVFGRSGDPDSLYKLFNLTPEKIVEAVNKL